MSTVSVSKQKKHRHEQDFIKRSTGEKVFNVVNIILMLILLAAMALMKRGTNKRVYGGV